MNRVIFGGGFDPIHLGHLNMALAARDTLNAQVIFVPAKVAVWKNDSINPVHKVNMIKLTIEDCPNLVIDTYELEQKEQPYSIETLRYFQKKYPKDHLYLLIGQDQANSFHMWKEAEEIAKIAQIVYFSRPKYVVNQENVNKYRMQALEGVEIDVSSSDVRELKSIKVPDSVLEYIENNDLYFISKAKSLIKESRYIHSLSVAHIACRIAKKHQLDYQKAYIAGLLHDIAKYIDKNESLSLMKKLFPDYVEIGAFAYHQFLGAYVAKSEFQVVDEEILDAIMYHATGKANMSWLGKLIYAIDKADPTRGYDSSALIKAMEDGIDDGFIVVLRANVEFLLSKNINLKNRLTEDCLACYLK